MRRIYCEAIESMPLAKSPGSSLFLASQRVFEITPLVPGSPSLDARPHAPGETRRQEYRKVDTGNRKEKLSAIRCTQSALKLCQSVTVVLKGRTPSAKHEHRP